jgi:putative ABC transport system permease protein
MPTRLQPGATPPDPGQGNETVDADQLAAQLNRLPGTGHLTETVEVPITLGTNTLGVDFLSGDYNTIGYQEELVRGRWLHGPGEAVAGSRAMHKAGLAVGDELTLRLGAKTTAVKIVGEVIEGVPGQGTLIADRATLDRLATDYRPRAEQVSFPIQLTAGTTAAQYEQQLTDAQLGLALGGEKRDQLFLAIVISLATLLSLLLATVAALGVFNTAVLNTRERRRDLGMLKSIGMTPGQVLTMVVTSMVALGLVGGLLGVPLGMLAHGLILPRMGRAALVDLPGFMLHVWQPVVLVLLILAGVAIAVLGALAPASAAARLRIAEVLHNE